MEGETTTADDIQTRLVSSVAVAPCKDWIDACMDYLRRTTPTSQAFGADEVLFQILYSDLRDVVRPLREEAHLNNNNNNNNEFPPSVKLREEIAASSKADHDHKRVLPESFALMCQVEEVADVTKSAEQRLGGSANSNANANTNANGSNQRRGFSAPRYCSKVFFSDGHHSNNSELHCFIVGIETMPIKGLSPTTPEGSKVLLRGPLEVRHGVLLLHPGNCVVLGGYCSFLVEHIAKAREAARKKAGVGVDPTIRALIGSTGFTADENDDENADDEAHEASGDVVLAADRDRNRIPGGNSATEQAPPLRRPQQQQPTASIPRTAAHSNSNSNSNNSNHPAVQNNQSPLAAGRKRNASMMSNHSNSNIQSRDSALPSSSLALASSSATASRATGATTRNPYAGSGGRRQSDNSNSNGNATGTATGTATATANPYHKQQPQQQRQPQQPPPQKRLRPAAAPESAEPKTTTTTAAARITPISSQQHQTTAMATIYNNNNNNSRKVVQSTKITGAGAGPPGKRTNETGTGTTNGEEHRPSTSSVVQNMNFASLRKLLLQLLGNKDMYESFYRRKTIFRVELCVPDPNHFSFDVVKIPKHQQRQSGSNQKKPPPNHQNKPKKKYEYFTSAFFGDNSSSSRGDSASDHSGSLACMIHSELLEPCFEVSANGLRALSRTDRPRCTSITNGGGVAVRKAYFGKRVWLATLRLEPQGAFRDSGAATSLEQTLVDLRKPILLLEQEPLT